MPHPREIIPFILLNLALKIHELMGKRELVITENTCDLISRVLPKKITTEETPAWL